MGAANAFSTAPARPGAGPPGPVESDDVGQGLEATNPYIIDGPVSEDTQFFGRERTLQWAAEILGGRATRRVLVVQGSYRIGKTSFLHHLQRRLQQTSFLVNLSTGQDDALAYLLWRAAVDIASIVRELTGRLFTEPEFSDFVSDASYFHGVFLPAVYKTLRRKRLVLAFDGLESLAGDDGAVRDAFYGYLASLMESDLGLSLVLAVEDWPEAVPAVFDDAFRVKLGPLDSTAATTLIVEPSAGVLDFDYQAIRRILGLSSGHPYITQLICHVLFERCLIRGRVTDKDVEGVVEHVLDLASPYMEHLWSRVSSPAQTVLAALASLRGARGILLEQDLSYALRRKGAGLSPSEIRQACHGLIASDVLEGLGAMSYKFRVELFRVWLAARRGAEVWRKTRGTGRIVATAGDWIGRFLWPMIGLLAVSAVVFSCLLSWPALGDRELPSATPVETREQSGLSYALVTPTPDLRQTPTPVPTPRPPTLDIAYTQWEEDTESWDIYAMSRDGSMVERLTENDTDDTSPVWSRDHSWLVFVSSRDGNQEVYRLDMGGAEPVNLSRNPAPDWTPSISPDGTRIVFSSIRDGNWELYMTNADGSEPARMTFNEEPDYSPVWSPDGSQIAFVSERDGNLEIYVMRSDGSQESRLTFNDALDLAPAWSPDGSLIAFESYRQGNMDVYVMNGDGTEQKNLTNYPVADDHGPTWSEDGLGLVFYSNRDGNWDLCFMNAQGGEVVNLTNTAVLEQEPFWSS